MYIHAYMYMYIVCLPLSGGIMAGCGWEPEGGQLNFTLELKTGSSNLSHFLVELLAYTDLFEEPSLSA